MKLNNKQADLDFDQCTERAPELGTKPFKINFGKVHDAGRRLLNA